MSKSRLSSLRDDMCVSIHDRGSIPVLRRTILHRRGWVCSDQEVIQAADGIIGTLLRFYLTILILLMQAVSVAESATITVYGLDSATFERLFDPNARPQQLLLVSGSLKLIGGSKGTWETVTYIPRKSTAPTSDRGVFTRVGTRIVFYSWLTFSRYAGEILEEGERLRVSKVNRFGQSQTETWYLGR